MKMTVVTAIMGQLNETKPVYASWLASIGTEANLLIIDNAPTSGEEQVKFFANFVQPHWPGEVIYAPMNDNLGVVKSLQWAYENTRTDILCYLHNDLYIFEQDWGKQVVEWFEHEPDTGLLGFFGAEGVSPSSGRFYVWNNMLEAEIHGNRLRSGHKQVAVLDGLCMIANRKMLDAKGGVDLLYDVHHFYDLDLSLESIERGFKNYILPIYCHHQSGITACRPLFQEWANRYVGQDKGEQALYSKNLQRFKDKWAHRLPYSVQTGWSS